MSSITFRQLIIFSPIGEVAKIINLEPGLNVITSLQKNGSDLGKSLIAKSFYHCLGADCLFDSKFEAANKIFILVFEYHGEEYTIYRSNTLFKLFDPDLRLLCETSHRHKLGELLYDWFGFAIWLPSRESGSIEIAPPVFSYVPYFIDQNHYNGSSFGSFDSLGQYKNYKGDLIYTIAGVYDEDYFDAKTQREPLEIERKNKEEELRVNKTMASHVNEELAGLGYSSSMIALSIDCDQHESEYRSLSQQLSKQRDKLYELRERRSQLLHALDGAKTLSGYLNKRINSFDGNTCPICSSVIENDMAVRVEACVTHADVLMLGDELNKELEDIERQIARRETSYEQILDNLNKLKSTMQTMKNADLTAVQVEGLTKLGEKLTYERTKLERDIDDLKNKLFEIDKLLREYAEEKAKVNKRYVEIISSYVYDLNLQSIDLNKIKTVTDRFSADGSNAPLATVAWYFSLLKLKEELNPERISLPLILDSPLNVEADDEKYDTHYELIFKKFKYPHQMLVTGLGLASSSVVPDDAHIVILKNEKYHLLNREDFDKARAFVFECMEQHMV